nr:PepSY domain-containing protein [Neobacillus sp. Marseille-Q6967]
MNWRSFILGAAVGAVSGYAVKEIISQKTYVSPEKVLENVKKQFSQNGPINGSWIHMEVEPFEKHQLKYQVYKGGISKNQNGVHEQYEFIADASTGTLLELRDAAKT